MGRVYGIQKSRFFNRVVDAIYHTVSFASDIITTIARTHNGVMTANNSQVYFTPVSTGSGGNAGNIAICEIAICDDGEICGP